MDMWERESQEWGTKNAETLWEPRKCAQEIARRSSMSEDSGQGGAGCEEPGESRQLAGKDLKSCCKNTRVYTEQDGSHQKMLDTGATRSP